MTTRQAIKLLDALGDMVEEWDDPNDTNDYLGAIELAQDALRSFPTDEFAL